MTKKIFFILFIFVIIIGLFFGWRLRRARKAQVSLLTCSQSGGTICSAEQSCVGPLIKTSDSNSCCSTQCNPKGGMIDLTIDVSQKKERIDNLTTGIGTMIITPESSQWQYYKDQIGLKNQIVRLQYNPLFGYPDIHSDHFNRFDPMIEDILKNGGTPLIMFGGLPDSIEKGDSAFRSKKAGWTGWPYRSTLPPKDFADWENWVYQAVNYWANEKGYNFYLEIWNEPDGLIFWRGTQTQAFEIYKYGLQGAKRASQKIKVGGMAFASEEWLENFLSYATSNQLELDFLSWHTYGRGPSVNSKELLEKYGYQNTEMIIDEWAIDAGETNLSRDSEKHPSYMAGIIKLFLKRGIARQTFFFLEELSPDKKEFHGDLGVFTSSGIIKPSFNFLLMLSKMSGNQIEIQPDDISAMGSVDDKKVFVLLWSGESDQLVKLSIKNLPFNGKARYEFYLIDPTHSNSFSLKDKIQAMDLSKIENVSAINNWPEVKLFSETKTTTISANSLEEMISLKPYSTMLIILNPI